MIQAERREAGEGRRRAAVPGLPARPVRPPAEEPPAGAGRLADRAEGTKEEVDAKLAELGIDGSVRAEALDVEQHLRLAAAFGE